ncbi:MAG: class I SAM-dependent methyltransferase [Leptospiraceae bacterium]|nr:class I SAM-dependent methyltransferase [Leptospiraceae bacterium]MCP5502553.1 class I SAM-dependent methyltransferase [Leptospiraceae bacterium]
MKNLNSNRFSTSSANGLPFEDQFWTEIYGDGFNVDGTFNAKEHASYVYSLFRLMNISVSSLIDFGFGKGYLLKEMVQKLKPQKVIGIEPSQLMVSSLIADDWVDKWNIAIQQNTIESFNAKPFEKEPFELGICNSVLQYIREDIPSVFEKLSGVVRYLYFTVPTDKDYKRMKKELDFEDPYAYARSRAFYKKAYSPYFTVVSYNLLESKSVKKIHYSFMEEIFRF